MFGNIYTGFESFTLKIDGKEQHGRIGRHRIHLLPTNTSKIPLYVQQLPQKTNWKLAESLLYKQGYKKTQSIKIT